MIDKPGLYEMSAAEYHADPCPEPSLSSSIAKELLSSSPKHAWWSHPKLNPAYEPEHKAAFDLGTAVHALLLEGESGCVLVDAPDWRTNVAKAQRAAAWAEGKTPLLRRQWDEVQLMAEAANRQLDKHQDRPRPLSNGKPEQVLIWKQGGVWCRARLDWLHFDRRMVDDYKSTGVTANPEIWGRRLLYGMGYDIQDAFYTDGVQAVFGVEAGFRFVVQETFAPYALSVVGLEPAALELARSKVAHAVALWGQCLKSGTFPGYPTKTCWASLPGWEETQWLERQARDSWARGLEDDGRPIDELLNQEDPAR